MQNGKGPEHTEVLRVTSESLDEDKRVRFGILSLLYSARRADVDRPGLGPVELERVLACGQEHLKFHVWYLKENGWVQRLENGHFAITATGVDKVMEMGMPGQRARERLVSVNGAAEA
jgi:hypothetical protein